MNFEYFTIGGGWYLWVFFDSVAAIAQSQAFRDAVLAASVVGGGWLTLNIAFEQRWNSTGTWFATLAIILYGFMAPVSTVKITDTISHAESGGYIVDNVPFGLAFFGSITNNSGKLMTDLFEQNFADPDSPLLQEHGFLFGTRLLAEATRMEITDANFSKTFSSYIRNCVFYDILNHRKSIDGLKTAANPFAWIIDDPHEAQMFELIETTPIGVNSDIVTCAEGTPKIVEGMTGATTDAERRLAAGVSSTRTTRSRDAIRAIVVAELGNFHDYLIGTARTAEEILQRQITINSILRGPAEWLGETGNDAAMKDYIDARLQLQTRQSYGSTGRQSEKWVPILKATFQCIFIAIFPFAILLMVTPIGGTIIRNYLIGLVWIESWGPLFSILNYMMNSSAQTQMQSVLNATGTESDISLFAQAGIQAVHADIAVQAGHLAILVPFISIALAAGVGRFAYLASSTLAVSQEAVADTTRESATGNFSVGNTSLGNHTGNNTSMFDHNTSQSYFDGETSTNALDGTGYRTTAGNNNIYDQEASASRLLTNHRFGESANKSLNEAYTASEERVEGINVAISDSQEAARNNSIAWGDSVARGEGTSFTYTNTEVGNETQDAKIGESVSRTFAQDNNLTESQSARLLGQVSAGASLKDVLSGSLQGTFTSEAVATTAYNNAVKATESEEVASAFQRLSNASASEGASFTTNEGQSFNETQAATQSETNALRKDHSAALQEREQYQNALSLSEGVHFSSDENLNQKYVEFLQEQLDTNDPDTINNFLKSDEDDVVSKREGLLSEFKASIVGDTLEAVGAHDLAAKYEDNASAIINSQEGDIGEVAETHASTVPTLNSATTPTPSEIKSDTLDNIGNRGSEVEKAKARLEEGAGDIEATATAGQGQSLPGAALDNAARTVDGVIITGAEAVADAGQAAHTAIEENSTLASQTSAAGQFGPSSPGLTPAIEPPPSIIADDPALSNNANTNTHKGSGDTALSDDPSAVISPHSIPTGAANSTVVDTPSNADGQAVTNQDNTPEAPAPVVTTEGASTPNNDGAPVVPSQNITSQEATPADTTEGASTPNNEGAPVVPSQNITPQETAPVVTTEGDSTPNNEGAPVVPSQNITSQETAPVDTTEGASTPNNDGAPVVTNSGITPTPEAGASAPDNASANNTTSGLINPETLGSTITDEYTALDTNLGDDKQSSKGKSDASEEDNKDDDATGGHGQGNQKPKDWK